MYIIIMLCFIILTLSIEASHFGWWQSYKTVFFNQLINQSIIYVVFRRPNVLPVSKRATAHEWNIVPFYHYPLKFLIMQRSDSTRAPIRQRWTSEFTTTELIYLGRDQSCAEFVMVEWNFSPRCSYSLENLHTSKCFQFNVSPLELHSQRKVLIRQHVLQAWFARYTLASGAEILHYITL